jgi:hypothetical protein
MAGILDLSVLNSLRSWDVVRSEPSTGLHSSNRPSGPVPRDSHDTGMPCNVCGVGSPFHEFFPPVRREGI